MVNLSIDFTRKKKPTPIEHVPDEADDRENAEAGLSTAEEAAEEKAE